MIDNREALKQAREQDHTCEFCYYSDFDEAVYPCCRCICNEPTENKWKPKEQEHEDVVGVVRCKDCKHHEEISYNHDGKVLCWAHDIDVVVDRNGYCNYGEREEQEHEV